MENVIVREGQNKHLCMCGNYFFVGFPEHGSHGMKVIACDDKYFFAHVPCKLNKGKADREVAREIMFNLHRDAVPDEDRRTFSVADRANGIIIWMDRK